MKRKKSPQGQYNDLLSALQLEYNRWHYLHDFGGEDPFWPDGVNMELVRNHIIFYKRELRTLCESEVLPEPEDLALPLPPIVPPNYMARSDEICMSARKALQVYKGSEDYQYLLRSKDCPDITQDKLARKVKAVIGYITSLEEAIESDDLVRMRQYQNTDSYIDALQGAANEVKTLLEEKVGVSLECD